MLKGPFFGLTGAPENGQIRPKTVSSKNTKKQGAPKRSHDLNTKSPENMRGEENSSVTEK